MHFDDLTDQTLGAYPDDVVHVGVPHSGRNDQWSGHL